MTLGENLKRTSKIKDPAYHRREIQKAAKKKGITLKMVESALGMAEGNKKFVREHRERDFK